MSKQEGGDGSRSQTIIERIKQKILRHPGNKHTATPVQNIDPMIRMEELAYKDDAKFNAMRESIAMLLRETSPVQKRQQAKLVQLLHDATDNPERMPAFVAYSNLMLEKYKEFIEANSETVTLPRGLEEIVECVHSAAKTKRELRLADEFQHKYTDLASNMDKKNR